MWKLWIDRVSMAILVGLLAYFLVQRLPGILKQWNLEGTHVSNPLLGVDLSGTQVDIAQAPGDKVLVFWATWCGPCTVELDRVKEAVNNGEILGSAIWAINMGEDEALVRSAVQERGYTFRVVRDVDGKISGEFQVAVTPTVVFLSEEQKVEWVTSGISPTLVIRIKRFLGSMADQESSH